MTTGNVTTIAGTGEAGYVDGPGATAQFGASGLLLDGKGHLLIADFDNGALRRMSLATREVQTIIGKRDERGVRLGDRAAARLNRPGRLALLPNGDVVIADWAENVLLRLRLH